MSLFNKIFGVSPKKSPPAKADRDVGSGIGEFVYLVNYREKYETALGTHLSKNALAELFLFRGWTTQFGYRIFSNNQAASEDIITETVSLTSYIGKDTFEKIHGFSIEESLEGEYMNLLESRWQEYDLTYINSKDIEPYKLAAPQLAGKLSKFIGITDPAIIMLLEAQFSLHLLELKERAHKLGLH